MHKILMIETATEACSVALAVDCNTIAERYIKEFKAHARLLAPFLEQVLNEACMSISDCDAVAVSEGPGSYTGLRVGVSTAKGVCYGAGKPLISIGTLDILAMQGKEYIVSENSLIIPMIDARRMEVYCAKFDNSIKKISPTEAVVLDEFSFSDDFRKYDNLIFIGDGVSKFKPILSDENQQKSKFIDTCPSARYMAAPVFEAWTKKEFKDVAYFEPFYLKEFQAGISKKSLL